MIKLTQVYYTFKHEKKEETIWIPVEGVIVKSSGNGSMLKFADGDYYVKESPEEVVRKIMIYKMEILDFQACLNNPEISSTVDSVKQLYKLAGLIDGLEQTP